MDLDAIASLLGPHAQLIYLFGSVARGEDHARSDIDLAWVPADPDLLLSEEATLQAELERTLRRPVDLVRLDGANVLVRWRVARDGKLLFEARPGLDTRFRSRAAIDHAELAPRLAQYGERLRQRLVGR